MASSTKPEDVAHWNTVNKKTMVYERMMFENLIEELADNVICIAVGAIAWELAPHLLEGTNIKFFNKNIPLPHPSKSTNGWMTTTERDCMVKGGL